jgi:hypothetical protein
MDMAPGNKRQSKARAASKCVHDERLPNAGKPIMP